MNQRKGYNDRKEYFMINLYERMLPDPAMVVPATCDKSDANPTEPPRSSERERERERDRERQREREVYA